MAWRRQWLVVLLAAASPVVIAVAPPPADSASTEYLSVDDPILDELRMLDVLDPGPVRGRILLPRLNTQPLQRVELQGDTLAPSSLSSIHAITLARIERALGRDAATWFPPHPVYRSTPRLYQRADDGQRFEASTGLIGEIDWDESDAEAVSGSGWESRIALGLDGWLAYTRLIVGKFDDARTFSDPIVSGTDVIALTDETYIAYTGDRQRWAMQFGQSRWHWGPGEEGSLVISKTSPSMVGLAMRAHLSSLRLDLIALSATVEQAAGEQLAAHRIEWQPLSSLRIGVTEAARYNWPGWQPLYALGAIPYVLVQRLLNQAEPDSAEAHRNNILTSFDASWRVAPGTRIYGEVLLDDLQVESTVNPNKYAFQLGYEGVAPLAGGRMSWGGEYTRVTQFVYTSFFDRDYVLQDQAIGYPFSPDSRRLKVRAAWDPNPDWQVFMTALHFDKGENDLDEPFIPGSARVNSSELSGVVETTREFQIGLRWWPASGVDLRASAGYRWIDEPEHVLGARSESPVGTLVVRINR
jgi:Capsule assembly protein Wzi